MREHQEETANPLDKQLEIFKRFILIRAGIEQFLTPIASRQGLTPIGVFILCLVSEQENPTISRVCRDMHLNQGNASNMCKKLEQRGFITRTRSTADERLVRIELTDSFGKICIERRIVGNRQDFGANPCTRPVIVPKFGRKLSKNRKAYRYFIRTIFFIN